jgi:hypothetical protein
MHNEKLYNLYLSPNIIRRSNQGGRDMWHAWERNEKCKICRWETQKGREHSEDRGIDGKMGRLAGGVWSGFN